MGAFESPCVEWQMHLCGSFSVCQEATKSLIFFLPLYILLKVTWLTPNCEMGNKPWCICLGLFCSSWYACKACCSEAFFAHLSFLFLTPSGMAFPGMCQTGNRSRSTIIKESTQIEAQEQCHGPVRVIPCRVIPSE